MNELENRVTALEAVLGIGNFQSKSVQQKDATFNGHFGLINRLTLPTYAKKGELCIVNGVLYVASATNTWSATGVAGAYAGEVSVTGTATILPTGWSSALSSHNYTVTHNLATTNYAVVANAINSTTAFVVATINRNSNDFLIQFETTGGTATDTRFSFTLIIIS